MHATHIQQQAPLAEELIKKFHAMLMKGLVVDGNQPGYYRTTGVTVGDAAHRASIRRPGY